MHWSLSLLPSLFISFQIIAVDLNSGDFRFAIQSNPYHLKEFQSAEVQTVNQHSAMREGSKKVIRLRSGKMAASGPEFRAHRPFGTTL
jgi:hypothetical protein